MTSISQHDNNHDPLTAISMAVARIEAKLEGLEGLEVRIRAVELTVSNMSSRDTEHSDRTRRISELEQTLALVKSSMPAKAPWYLRASGVSASLNSFILAGAVVFMLSKIGGM